MSIRLTIEDMHDLARINEGKCLSQHYVNSHTKLLWQCKCGNKFESSASQIKHQKQWCPICGKKKANSKRKLTIEEMHALAKKNNGVCLSNSYVDAKTKLDWKCKFGHVFKSSPDQVKHQNQWCPECSKNKPLSLEFFHDYAKQHGGKCISKVYSNIQQNIKFQCQRGHKFQLRGASVRYQKSWCLICHNMEFSEKAMKDGLVRCIAKAQENDGKFLSKSYSGFDEVHEWKCANGHKWKASPNSIFRGSWCPYCQNFRQEEICRAIFEKVFKCAFPKVRPNWLINSLGNKMELDGYCEDMGVAFEFQGAQHYEVGFFTKDKEALTKRKRDDKLKRDLCRAHNIILVEPNSNTELNKLPEIIKEKLLENNRSIEQLDLETIDDIANLYSPSAMLEKIKKIAVDRGGKCLSDIYENIDKKLDWECSEGHFWSASANNVIHKWSWCPECAGNKTLTIQHFQKIAKTNGGRCLSQFYKNNSSKLKFQCSEGHIFESAPSQVKNQTQWCPKCAIIRNADRQRLTIDEMRRIAQSKNGECLSEKYVNSHEKLLWKCSCGHEFLSSPNQVRLRGQWCPKCSKNSKLNIEIFFELARTKGGECLSREYINSHQKLKFRCSRGHLFERTPNALRNKNSWCPDCKD